MAIVWEEIKMSPGSLLLICRERKHREERGRRRWEGEGWRWEMDTDKFRYLCVSYVCQVSDVWGLNSKCNEAIWFYFELRLPLSSSPTGGPPHLKGAHGHRHPGRHFQGNPKGVPRHHLQAGGQHQRGGLDGLQTRQESQGRAQIHAQAHSFRATVWTAKYSGRPEKVWMLLGDTHASTRTHTEGEKNMRRNICSRSWPQARNSPGVCNYSLSTAAHLASFKGLRPSQNRHTSPSSERYLTSSGEAALRPRSLLFTSHLVPVTRWSEFCLASTFSWTGFWAASLWGVQAWWITSAFWGCRAVEMKQTVPRVFKTVATAIKVEGAFQWLWLFFPSRPLSLSLPRTVCLSCGLSPTSRSAL